MARECLKSCPRILELSHPHAAGLFPSDIAVLDSHARALQRAIDESANCPGPTVEVIDVRRGILHRRVARESVVMCGLDQGSTVNSQTETPGRMH